MTSKFTGMTDTDSVDALDGITGATFSSKGLKNAVKCALETFELNKEAILSD